MLVIPTMTYCWWCGQQGDIENPKPGTAMPLKWKLLPFIVTSNLKPKKTRLQRHNDTRVPFCPDYGTEKCQPQPKRLAEARALASRVATDEQLIARFSDFITRVRPEDFGKIED